MTREQAIKVLRTDYCCNKVVCELHEDGLCQTENCEIWMAIKALETQPDWDVISRRSAIDAIENFGILDGYSDRMELIGRIEHLPSAQPEITPDGTLTVSIDADIANVGRILLSQAGTQYGGLYYKDAQPEPKNKLISEIEGKTPEETYDFLVWLLNDYGMQFTDSRQAVIEWLRGE